MKTDRHKKWLRWTAVALALSAALLSAWQLAFARSQPAAAYDTAPVVRGPIVARVTATGVASALVTVQVGAQVSGRIQEIDADFNATVKKGQVIARIDPALLSAAVAQA